MTLDLKEAQRQHEKLGWRFLIVLAIYAGGIGIIGGVACLMWALLKLFYLAG